MDSSWSMTAKIVAMLDLHLAMAYGCDRILHYEAMGKTYCCVWQITLCGITIMVLSFINNVFLSVLYNY